MKEEETRVVSSDLDKNTCSLHIHVGQTFVFTCVYSSCRLMTPVLNYYPEFKNKEADIH